MVEMAQQVKKFETVQLFKDKTLGFGSYGKVCKAKCDDLLCAAKLIHETLLDPTAQQLIAPQRKHRLPMRRFEQECEFLSTITHPNIVQYLGIYQDLDTGLPALLMELMDDSLTHFLETSTQPIPYHIQVNICHDITLALSFLHSNDIVHRDLSSNNVLLIGNVRAKVTDFGMARLGENPQATHLTFTTCPGTDAFMPPEAVQDEPVYTEKIDCFSFGVITLQILTRKFPKPGNRRKRIEINHPRLPTGTTAPIPETERRQNHIREVDPNNSLRQVVLDCLKDRDVERPSSHQLCERVAALKESPEYSESVRTTQEGSTSEQGGGSERDRELRSLRHEHAQQVETLQLLLEEKDMAIIEKEQEIEQLVRELGHINQKLEDSVQTNAQFQIRISELEQLRQAEDATSRRKQQSRSGVRINILWRKGVNALCKMSSYYNAVANDTALYVRTRCSHMYAYTTSTSTWSQLPNIPTSECPPVIINNLLTLVGGHLITDGSNETNQLFSLTGEGSDRGWTEEFPPMPTKRCGVTALYTGSALIVAGGIGVDGNALQTVEVMYTETLQWSTATDLPQPVSRAPGAVCGDCFYILSLGAQFKSTYTCSVNTLLQSCRSRSTAGVWNQVAAPPVGSITCVSIHGQLLTIGGRDSNGETTAAVHMYNPTTDFWEVISHMATPRYNCFAAVLPNNQLMVVGGVTASDIDTDSVELAAID